MVLYIIGCDEEFQLQFVQRMNCNTEIVRMVLDFYVDLVKFSIQCYNQKKILDKIKYTQKILLNMQDTISI